MVILEHVHMRYATEEGPITVLEDANLQIQAGETVAITGPSGSGKTTLLLLLSGLERPQAGRVLLNGQDLATLDADALADLRRDRMGIILQSFHLIPSLTALGNASLPLEIAARDGARREALALLEAVGLGHRAHHYPNQLSGGEQQRVAIARALVHRPALVIGDEPTGNLDRRTGERIIEQLFELHRAAGSTLVLVTHDDSVAARCQRVLRLENGQLRETS